MNDSENKNIIGIGYLVAQAESFIISKLIFLYKLLKKYCNFAFMRLAEILKFCFSKENKKSTLTAIIISVLIIKIIQIIKTWIKGSISKELGIGLKEREINESINQTVNEIQNKQVLDKTETNDILLAYTPNLANKKQKFLKDNIQMIHKAIEIQNKMRDKHNLPKESINSPFYNILKLFINENYNKN